MEETTLLIEIYNLVKWDGVYGVLMILSWLLWLKVERKDKMIYELIWVNKEIIDNQKQTLERLKELNESILKMLIK